jgi:hypothetical protein
MIATLLCANAFLVVWVNQIELTATGTSGSIGVRAPRSQVGSTEIFSPAQESLSSVSGDEVFMWHKLQTMLVPKLGSTISDE